MNDRKREKIALLLNVLIVVFAVAGTILMLFFRSNDLGLQFRCYATSNAGSDTYCAVLTIYKYIP